MSAQSAITLHDLSFEWPDGSPALHRLNGTMTTGRTGLVGRNGAGKSTLLRLIAGKLKPTLGRVETVGDVGYLPQTLTLGHHTTVAVLLGIDGTLKALHAIEAGDVDERHFDAVGDDWDIESRTDEALHEIGFSADDLNRRVGEVSGGEAMLIALTGLRIRRTPVTLLDEPSNNLDRRTRAKLADFVDSWPGTLVVVSHDLELLEHMDSTAELHSGKLDVFGGPYSLFTGHREQEQASAVQAARSAQQALKVEKKQRVEAETKLARRERTAKKTQASGGIPKILAGNRASKAQASAGSMRSILDDKVLSAQAAVDAADARVREVEHIHLTLPDPDVPRSRRIAELGDGSRTIVIQGPERVALVGPNGSGKSTLLKHLVEGRPAESSGRISGRLLTDRVGYLPQRLDGLDDSLSALDNVREAAPASAPGDIRNQLARLLLRGSTVDRPVSSLSGGERFRVSLAKLLLAEPPAQLLILDEPTNNLDFASVKQLAEALDAYRGSLLIVSHDLGFLRRLNIDTVAELDGEGGLRERTEPLA
ncbi:ATP-binding cassette domain-containing protein [Arthrobacter sp. KNU40]|uniref:ABC-F family ATP-binding cassette domain-containing protein n=1 Tax=Arthrobacter sp. KNU40 TaxID=3447965 RepID=UPI003F6081DD